MPGLWRHPAFLRLWAGQTVSQFGSTVGIAAMGFTAILWLRATPFELGLLSACRLAPALVAGLPAGAWIDRLSRRRVLIAVDCGRALLLATIPLAAFLGTLRMPQLCAVTFFVSILTVVFDIAYPSWLPSLIEREDLVEGNSKLAGTEAAAEAGGFGIAGWLVQLLSAPGAILIDAASFVVSAVSIWSIRVPEPAPEGRGSAVLRSEIAEGLRAVRAHPILRPLALSQLSRAFFTNLYGALVLLYMTRDLGFAPGILGVIFALGGISALFGAAAVPVLNRRFGRVNAMAVGMLLFGLSLLFVPLARGATFAAAALLVLQQLVGDGAITVCQVNVVSLRQSEAPERLLGRVTSVSAFLETGASLAGALTGGAMGQFIGVRATLFSGALGVMLSSAWFRGLRISR